MPHNGRLVTYTLPKIYCYVKNVVEGTELTAETDSRRDRTGKLLPKLYKISNSKSTQYLETHGMEGVPR